MTPDKRETLERWLFNYTEPPFDETTEVLAQQYEENLRELKRAEPDSTWEVDDLVCTPEEIARVVEERLQFIRTEEV